MESNKETHQFKTEVQQLLNLIINSLYSNKEIFLRELISNASDAIDRLRFNSQTDPTILKDDTDFKIKIIADKDAKTIEVSDNGIGMTRQDVIDNIGTIAKSGTAEFLKSLKENKAALTPELIGQFGVGFYSSFMVAEKVTLITKAAGSDKAVKWESIGDGSYIIEDTEKESRGTKVILHLKKQEDVEQDFTQEWTIKSIIKNHSDFVSYPIVMDVEKIDDEDDKGSQDILDKDGKPMSKKPEIIDSTGKKVETKKIVEETLNSMKAIWLKSKNEVKDEEYNEFYTHITHDSTEPLAHLHTKMEGSTEYYSLLYIPSTAPFDLFMRERKHGVDLYCKRIFIMHNCKELMPEYLRFVKGVVDSSDLDLNVSREILQQNKIVTNIRKNLVKKVLDLLAGMESEKFEKFYKNFGVTLKEGVHTDWENKDKIAELLRFKTTKSNDKYISLNDYIANMKPDQKDIYYITGEKLSTLINSPALEKLKDKDFEVLLMIDVVDEFVVQALTEFKEKKLRSVEKGDLDIDKVDDDKKKEMSNLLQHIKTILDDNVKDVKPSTRLKDSVACLSGDDYDMSSYMEKILKASGHEMPKHKRILEINLDHPCIAKLNSLYQSNPTNPNINQYAQILFDMALISEGNRLDNPAQFNCRIADMMAKIID